MHPLNPDKRKLARLVEGLRLGGVAIFPTDTVYGVGCDLFQSKALQKIARMKSQKPEKLHLSIICNDMSMVSTYVKQLDTPTFKLLKRNLPGPFTFILEASAKIPKLFDARKKTIGIRIPNHTLPLALVDLLGNPLITTSIKSEDLVLEYDTEPSLIFDEYKNKVDFMVDSGLGGNIPSTIVDCTGELPCIVRQGAGELVW